jgi:DNA-binding NtrC family response regulator
MSKNDTHILVVDDEPDIRELVKDILEDEGYQVSTASDGQSAREALTLQRPNLILLDIWMPDIDGISLLREFMDHDNQLTIIMMSGHGTIETAVEATRLGATDFIEKPLSTAKLLRGVEVALDNKAKQVAKHQFSIQEPVGKSQQITLLREQARRVAKHNMPILLTGEGGTGKHCFAHYLHSLGSYDKGKFIELTDETFPLDSQKLIALAKGNCIFLHDIANLNEKAQGLLSHMLDSHKLEGCQLIFSTQRSLEHAVINGSFLESLLYQINSISLNLPPLRQHVEDIPELVHHFVDQHTSESQLPYRRFTVSAQNRLRNYAWPGNVTELKNIIQRLLLLSEHDEIDETDIEQTLHNVTETNHNNTTINYDLPLREAREQFERIYLLHKLEYTDGNVGKAAKLAGMERTHLYRKLRSLGIDAKQNQDTV